MTWDLLQHEDDEEDDDDMNADDDKSVRRHGSDLSAADLAIQDLFLTDDSLDELDDSSDQTQRTRIYPSFFTANSLVQPIC